MQRQPRIIREDLYLAPCAVTTPCALAQLSPCTLTVPGAVAHAGPVGIRPVRAEPYTVARSGSSAVARSGSSAVARTLCGHAHYAGRWHWIECGCLYHARSLEWCVVACAIHGHSSGAWLYAPSTVTRAVRAYLQLARSRRRTRHSYRTLCAARWGVVAWSCVFHRVRSYLVALALR